MILFFYFQGLYVGDYISSVNNQNVESMGGPDFNKLMRSSAEHIKHTGRSLLLEVIREDSSQPQRSYDGRSQSNTLYDDDLDLNLSENENYPEIRLCTIRVRSLLFLS